MSAHAQHGTGQSCVLTAMGRLLERVEALSDADLALRSRRHGWTAAELVVSADLELQHLLRNLVMPSSQPVAHRGERCAYRPDGSAHRLRGTQAEYDRLVRGVAAAHASPTGLRADLLVIVDAVSSAVVALDDGTLWADGHLVCTGDLLQSWSVLVNDYVADLPISVP